MSYTPYGIERSATHVNNQSFFEIWCKNAPSWRVKIKRLLWRITRHWEVMEEKGMDKKYQVFVSSTYQDLQEERQEVMHALLELDCMPAGMELFPAANDDQWSLIQKVIDDCDYYILILGGRYGSIGKEKISYTEMEYKYAIEKNKPVISFLHKLPGDIPSNKSESSTEGKIKLEEFREVVQQKMCKYWTNPSELGSVVSRSLVRLIKTNPAVGWVKADIATNQEATFEILKLRKKIEELEAELISISSRPPEGIEELSQDDDEFNLSFMITSNRNSNMKPSIVKKKDTFSTSWNNLFSAISPCMIDEADETEIDDVLNEYIRKNKVKEILEREDFLNRKLEKISIYQNDFDTVIIQLRALGLIQRCIKQRSLKDTATYWSLTPYGDNLMTKLRAIKKKQTVEHIESNITGYFEGVPSMAHSF